MLDLRMGIKYLLCKHEDLSWMLRIYIKTINLDMVVCTCKPSAGERDRPTRRTTGQGNNLSKWKWKAFLRVACKTDLWFTMCVCAHTHTLTNPFKLLVPYTSLSQPLWGMRPLGKHHAFVVLTVTISPSHLSLLHWVSKRPKMAQ